MPDRRSFVSRLVSMLPLAAAGTVLPRHLGATQQLPAWLEAIRKARHPLFLDVPSFRPDGTALRRAKAFLNAHEGAGAIAIGFHGDGLAYALGDALWRELDLATRFSLRGDAPVDGNPFARSGSSPSLAEMTHLGVRLLACRNTMRRWSENYSQRLGRPAADVLAQLESGLVPGAEPVPAMIVAAATAQEARVPYVIAP